jgi:signal transduction histidine kinase
LTEDRIRDDPETAATLVAAARRELTESLDELRELARGIHPAVLEHGLDTALDSLAVRSATPVRISYELDERLARPVELAAYFVACEGLANVAKYAQASEARIRVARREDTVVIEVSDDGVGGAESANGSGLRGLADRVEALGGRLRVTSPAGAGTALTAEMPCGRSTAGHSVETHSSRTP